MAGQVYLKSEVALSESLVQVLSKASRGLGPKLGRRSERSCTRYKTLQALGWNWQLCTQNARKLFLMYSR